MKGILLMTIVAVAQSFLLALSKYISPYLSTSVITLSYYLVPLLFLVPKLKQNKKLILDTTFKELLLFTIRGFFASFAVLLLFYSSRTSNFAAVAVLFNASPLFVIFISALVLSERIGFIGYLGGIIAFAGAYYVISPSSIHSFASDTTVFSLISAILMAVSIVMMKQFAYKKISALKIVFWLYLTATFWSILYLLIGHIVLHHFVTKSQFIFSGHYYLIFIVILFGLISLYSQRKLTQAFHLISASVASPILFLSVPVSAAMGYFIWGQYLTQSEIIGAVCVIIGVLLGLYSSFRSAK